MTQTEFKDVSVDTIIYIPGTNRKGVIISKDARGCWIRLSNNKCNYCHYLNISLEPAQQEVENVTSNCRNEPARLSG